MTDHFAGDLRTNHERMLAGDLYVAEGDPEIAAAQQRAVTLAAEFLTAYATDVDGAQAVARELFGSMDPTAHVRPPVHVDYGTYVTIGAGTFVNYGLMALDVAPITIGADCAFGPNVQLLTPTHPLDPDLRRAKLEAARPIVIGDNVWLGGGAIVLPGVTIGDHAVIGAGAVVTRDVPARSVAVGNPARVVKTV